VGDASVHDHDATEVDAGGTDGCRPRASIEEVERFLMDYRWAICEAMMSCGSALRWPDAATCVQFDPSAWSSSHRPFTIHALEQGRLAFDPVAAQECLSSIQVCADLVRSTGTLGTMAGRGRANPCFDVFPPRCRAVEGDGCRGDGECGPALHCPDTGPCAPRTCLPARELGELCVPERPSESVSCVAPSAEVADLGLCAASGGCSFARLGDAVGPGEACGEGELLEGVLTITPCADGLVCSRSDGRCVPLPAAGEPCVELACERPLWCNSGVCTHPEVLEPVPVGSDCDEASGWICNYQLGTTCLDGTCVRAGMAAGDPCDERVGAPRVWCQPPLSCDRATGTCAPDGDEVDGSECIFHHECRSGCCARARVDEVCVSTCAASEECG
jgi:hypothetical protein